MKTLETGSNRFSTWLGNATALPVELVHSIVSLHFGYKVDGAWQLGHVSIGHRDDRSLFYNAALFVRLVFPFGLFVGVRWAGKDPTAKEYAQLGIGWKLNGRLAALCRIQSDAASARGVSGANFGQAIGWEEGTK